MEAVSENMRPPQGDEPESLSSHFYLTNVSIERVGELVDEEPSPEIADLWVRDMEDNGDEGKCYLLISVTPNRWEVKGAIELPHHIHEIECEVHCTGGYIHSVFRVERMAKETQGTESGEGLRKTVEADDEGKSNGASRALAMGYEWGTDCTGDSLAPHINACSCDACIPGLAYTPKALETLQSALQLTPMSHPSIMRCFVKLAKEHQRSFQLDRDPCHIDDVISALSGALQLTARNNSDIPSLLKQLAEMFMVLLDLTGDISYLDQAISKHQEAVEVTGEKDHSLPCSQHDLGDLLQERFKRGGDLSDLSDSISTHVKALHLRLGSHTSLQILSEELTRSFPSFLRRIDLLLCGTNTRPLSPLCDAEEICIPSCGCNIPHLLDDIGSSLQLRAQRTGESSDINAAISVRRLLVQLTPESHPSLPGFLEELGSCLQDCFNHRGDVRDIDEAITVCQRAAQLLSGSGPSHSKHQCGHDCIMHRIGTCFLDKYTTMNKCDDLHEAINIFQQMVYVDSDGINHPCVGAWLQGLAKALSMRFDLTRDPRDLLEAISTQEKLVQRMGTGDENHVRHVVTLSQFLVISFREFGNLEDIDKAVSLGRRLIELGSDGDLPSQLASLAICLLERVRDQAATAVHPTLFEAFPREDGTPRLSSSLALDYVTEAIALLRKALGVTLCFTYFVICAIFLLLV